MPTIAELLDRTRAIEATRASARRATVESVRALERTVREHLAGARLRGLPNLSPDAPEEFRAARVRGARPSDALPFDGRAVLVLASDGVLCMAARVEDRTLRPRVSTASWPAEDADLVAEDGPAVARAVADALAEHVRSAGKGSGQFARLESFAGRLGALGA